MDIQRLMSMASGDVNFKILRILHEEPAYSGALASHLNCNIRTIRVHLHRLRQKNFVDFEEDGQKHIYYIKTPFASAQHEMIIGLIALAPPVEKHKKTNLEEDELPDVHPLLHDAQLEYWTTIVKGFFGTLLRQGSFSYQQKIQSELEEINDRIQHLKDQG